MADVLTCNGVLYVNDDEWVATYAVETESWPAEPFSWGESRGTETGAAARLVSATLDGRTLTREDVLRIKGAATVAVYERDAARTALEGCLAC